MILKVQSGTYGLLGFVTILTLSIRPCLTEPRTNRLQWDCRIHADIPI